MDLLILLAEHEACLAQHSEELRLSSCVINDICASSCASHPVLHPPPPPSSAVTMTAALIGDQLILEEDYDETYIPSEQGNHVAAQAKI